MNNDFLISQTGLSIYRNCPFAFYCYRSKKEPIFFNQDILDTGKYVHDALDRYYRQQYLTKGTMDDILAKTYENLSGSWDVTLPIDEFKKSYTCLQHHAKWEETQINNGIAIQPLTEEHLKHDIFHGIIDYIDLPKNRVMDWKTNKSANISFEYKMQSYIYKLLYESKFKTDLKIFEFYFLYPDEIKVINFSSSGMSEAIQEVNQLRELIKKSYEQHDYPKQPKSETLCKNCQYRLYCKLMV